MSFDLNAARAEYSDTEIAEYLARNRNFDLAGARAEGYSDTEIADYLSAREAVSLGTPYNDPGKRGNASGIARSSPDTESSSLSNVFSLFGRPKFSLPANEDSYAAALDDRARELLVDPVVRGYRQTAQASNVLTAGTGIEDLESAAADIATREAQLRSMPEADFMQRVREKIASLKQQPVNAMTYGEPEDLLAEGPLGLQTEPGSLVQILPEYLKDPRAALNIALESGAASAASLAGGGGAGFATGAVTANPIAIAAATAIGAGSGSFLVEYGNDVLETFRENGVNMADQASVLAAFQNPELMSQARDHAFRRGASVAAFDALSAGIAGRTAKVIERALPPGRTAPVIGELGEVFTQAGLGGAGEVAGAVSTGEKVDPEAVAQEIVGELGPGSAEILYGRYLQNAAEAKATSPQARADAARDNALNQAQSMLDTIRGGRRPPPPGAPPGAGGPPPAAPSGSGPPPFTLTQPTPDDFARILTGMPEMTSTPPPVDMSGLGLMSSVVPHDPFTPELPMADPNIQPGLPLDTMPAPPISGSPVPEPGGAQAPTAPTATPTQGTAKRSKVDDSRLAALRRHLTEIPPDERAFFLDNLARTGAISKADIPSLLAQAGETPLSSAFQQPAAPPASPAPQKPASAPAPHAAPADSTTQETAGGAASLPVFSMKHPDAEGPKFGATIGKFGEKDRRVLLVDSDGSYFWGDRSDGTQLGTGEAKAWGEHAAYPLAMFPTAKEAKAAGAATPQTKRAPSAAKKKPSAAVPPNKPTPPDDDDGDGGDGGTPAARTPPTKPKPPAPAGEPPKQAKLFDEEGKPTAPPAKAAPSPDASTALSTEPKKKSAFEDFMERAAKKFAMESEGQAILDDMEENDESPKEVGEHFWQNVYPLLNERTQKKFEGYVKSLGFKPGDVKFANKDGTTEEIRDWQDAGMFVSGDLPSEPRHLEGIERGFVAMMKWANTQAANVPAADAAPALPAPKSTKAATPEVAPTPKKGAKQKAAAPPLAELLPRPPKSNKLKAEIEEQRAQAEKLWPQFQAIKGELAKNHKYLAEKTRETIDEAMNDMADAPNAQLYFNAIARLASALETAVERVNPPKKPLDREAIYPKPEGPVREEVPLEPETDEQGRELPMPTTKEKFAEVINEHADLFADPEAKVLSTHHPDHSKTLSREEADKRVQGWMDHAFAQTLDDDKRHRNMGRAVISLFDLTGKWSQPYMDAGYNVIHVDLQSGHDIRDFSVEYIQENWPDVVDVYAILIAAPCTDFAGSGARHWARKDAEGKTELSKELVFQALRTVEYYRPQVWALENPTSRIEELTGLPKARYSFNPSDFSEPYTKKTHLWGKFSTDLPVAPVEPTEGSKMHSQFGGKSDETKNARSETPEGFAYAFFMANNAEDATPQERLVGEFPMAAGAIEAAVEAGFSEAQIREVLEDSNYDPGSGDARESQAALRKLVKTGKPKPEPKAKVTPPPTAEQLAKKYKKIPAENFQRAQDLGLNMKAIDFYLLHQEASDQTVETFEKYVLAVEMTKPGNYPYLVEQPKPKKEKEGEKKKRRPTAKEAAKINEDFGKTIGRLLPEWSWRKVPQLAAGTPEVKKFEAAIEKRVQAVRDTYGIKDDEKRYWDHAEAIADLRETVESALETVREKSPRAETKAKPAAEKKAAKPKRLQIPPPPVMRQKGTRPPKPLVAQIEKARAKLDELMPKYQQAKANWQGKGEPASIQYAQEQINFRLSEMRNAATFHDHSGYANGIESLANLVQSYIDATDNLLGEFEAAQKPSKLTIPPKPDALLELPDEVQEVVDQKIAEVQELWERYKQILPQLQEKEPYWADQIPRRIEDHLKEMDRTDEFAVPWYGYRLADIRSDLLHALELVGEKVDRPVDSTGEYRAWDKVVEENQITGQDENIGERAAKPKKARKAAGKGGIERMAEEEGERSSRHKRQDEAFITPSTVRENLMNHLDIDPTKFRLMGGEQQWAVATKAIKDKYGFAGIFKHPSQNWRNAVDHLLDAFESLQNMAQAMGQGTKIVSLNGAVSLHMRGKPGKTKGYYRHKGGLSGEPDRTIAVYNQEDVYSHELGHAIDYDMMERVGGTEDGGLSRMIREREDIAALPSTIKEAYADLMTAIYYDGAHIAAEIKAVEHQLEKSKAPKQREKLQKRLDNLRSGAWTGRGGKTQFYQRAKDGPMADYLKKPTELVARTFEAYMSWKIQSQRDLNLVKFLGATDAIYRDESDDWIKRVYPHGTDRMNIFTRWDALLGQIAREGVYNVKTHPPGFAESQVNLGLMDPVAQAKATGTPLVPEVIRAHNLTQESARTFLRDETRRRDTFKRNWQQLMKDIKNGGPGSLDTLRAAARQITSTPDSIFAFLENKFPQIGALRVIRNNLSDAHISGRNKPPGLYREIQRQEASNVNRVQDRLEAVGITRNMPSKWTDRMWDILHGEIEPANELEKKQADTIRYEFDYFWKMRDQFGETIGYTDERYMNRVFLNNVVDDPRFHADLTKLRVAEKEELVKDLLEQIENFEQGSPEEQALQRKLKAALEYDVEAATTEQIAAMKKLKWGEPIHVGAMNEDSAKERVFGPLADKILKDWYVKDPFHLLAMYAASAARGVVTRRRFGGENPKVVFDRWLVATARQLPSAYADILVDAMEVSLGFRKNGHSTAARVMNAYASIKTAAMLGRSVVPNISEPLNLLSKSFAPMRDLGNFFKALIPYMASEQQKERFAVADRFGRLSGTLVDAVSSTSAMAQAIGEDVAGNGMLARFSMKAYYFNLTAGLTAIYERALNRVGFEIFYEAARIVRKGGEDAGMYRQFLREHGISDAEAFANYLKGVDTVDRVKFEDTLKNGMERELANALEHFGKTTQQKPTPSLKHIQSHNGAIGVMFRLTSWVTSNFTNWAVVLKDRTKAAITGEYGGEKLTAGQRAGAMMYPVVMSLATMYVAQAFFVVARMMLTHPEEWEDRGDDDWDRLFSWKTQSQIAQYWGVLGWGLNTGIDAIEGTRFNRGAYGTVAGAVYGALAQDIERFAVAGIETYDELLGDKPEGTNTSEYNALQATYHQLSMLVNFAAVSATPASNIPASAVTAFWSFFGTAPFAERWFAQFFVGEKDAALEKKAKGGDIDAKMELKGRELERKLDPKRKEQEMEKKLENRP